MNDINEMPPKCQYCPYWEVCEYSWVCPDREQLATNLKQTCPATDTISRKAAIDAVHKSYDMILDFKTDGKTISSNIEDILSNLPSARSEQQWIPCSERMPEEGERVLATHLGGVNPNNQVIEHIYQHGEFTCGWDMDMNVDSPTFGQRYMGEVIAWLPLPEPYREDDNE